MLVVLAQSGKTGLWESHEYCLYTFLTSSPPPLSTSEVERKKISHLKLKDRQLVKVCLTARPIPHRDTKFYAKEPIRKGRFFLLFFADLCVKTGAKNSYTLWFPFSKTDQWARDLEAHINDVCRRIPRCISSLSCRLCLSLDIRVLSGMGSACAPSRAKTLRVSCKNVDLYLLQD